MDMADVAAQTLAFYLQLVAVLAGTGAVTALLILGAWRLIEAVAARRRQPPVHQTRQLAFNNTLAFKTTEELSAMEQEWRRREHLAANWPLRRRSPRMITLGRDLCFLDTETLGLDPAAPIWEFAAIRLNRDGTRDELHCQILHQQDHWLDTLPKQFADDYRARFDIQAAIPPAMAAREIQRITDGAIIAGSNPTFDIERLTRLLEHCARTPTWNFHPLDIPSMVVGWMAATDDVSVPWKSDALSELTGVLPANYQRHTALGDVEWCLAQWEAMTHD